MPLLRLILFAVALSCRTTEAEAEADAGAEAEAEAEGLIEAGAEAKAEALLKPEAQSLHGLCSRSCLPRFVLALRSAAFAVNGNRAKKKRKEGRLESHGPSARNTRRRGCLTSLQTTIAVFAKKKKKKKHIYIYMYETPRRVGSRRMLQRAPRLPVESRARSTLASGFAKGKKKHQKGGTRYGTPAHETLRVSWNRSSTQKFRNRNSARIPDSQKKRDGTPPCQTRFGIPKMVYQTVYQIAGTPGLCLS